MSGHNKWSSIKHRKGAQDAKRSKVFSRIAKMIIVAAQQGGSDPETNNTLKMLLDQARKANMPKDNVVRAIKHGTGDTDGAQMEEVVYEGMGPGGSMMIITCMTDNTNRTLTDVKTALKKNNGKFVPSGSTSFQFDHVGHIVTKPKDFDNAELAAIDAGAIDVERDGEHLLVITAIPDFASVRDYLIDAEIPIDDARLVYTAKQTISLDKNTQTSFTSLYDILDDLDDVQEIFTNISL